MGNHRQHWARKDGGGRRCGVIGRRQQAAQERVARERVRRVEQALRERQELAKLREQQKRDKGVKYDPEELRASTTDPEARKMKMGDGGFRPAYNVQFATATDSQVIVGVDVIQSGSDSGQMQPMVEQIEERDGVRGRGAVIDREPDFRLGSFK